MSHPRPMTASTAAASSTTAPPVVCRAEVSRFGIFTECPHCGGDMSPEHAHYRCGSCGWRDSCCD